MSIHGSHVFLQGSFLLDVAPLLHPKPLSGGPLSQLFLLVYSATCRFPGQELLPHNAAASKPWRYQTRLHSGTSGLPETPFSDRKRRRLSSTFPPLSRSPTVAHLCSGNISLQRTYPFHFTRLRFQASLPMKLEHVTSYAFGVFFFIFFL